MQLIIVVKHKIIRYKSIKYTHLYVKNYKTPMKEIQGDLNKRNDSPCSWVGRLNIGKTSILPKWSY